MNRFLAVLVVIIFASYALIEEQFIALQIYAVVSCVTLFCYWMDKRAAINGTARIPESSLHLLALFGGWPGALLAQQLLRHKTIKKPFQLVFWLSAFANIAGFLIVNSPRIRQTLLTSLA